jgi:hypothetical protein
VGTRTHDYARDDGPLHAADAARAGSFAARPICASAFRDYGNDGSTAAYEDRMAVRGTVR